MSNVVFLVEATTPVAWIMGIIRGSLTGVLVSNIATTVAKVLFSKCKSDYGMSQLPIVFKIKPTLLNMASILDDCTLPVYRDLRPYLCLLHSLCASHTGLCSGFTMLHAIS